MRVIFLTEKPDPDNEYLPRFRQKSVLGLVSAYNAQIGNPGWVSARGRYLHALYHELRRRHIDISFISPEPRVLALDHPVYYLPVLRALRPFPPKPEGKDVGIWAWLLYGLRLALSAFQKPPRRRKR